IPITSKSPSSLNDKPLVNLSPLDVKLASDYLAYSLIAKFSLLRPLVDLFEHHVNSSWGLKQPATIGLLDPKHILIHLHSAEDFAKAWSRESKIFDNRRFLLLRWTQAFNKRKDSSLSASWLRLPSLPLPYQNPAILETIGNSIGRFLRLDERTKKLKHPMAPRICVEMDLASKLPDEVVIAVGTEDIFHQKIEYDLRIGFCTFCHLQGHFEGNCRRKLLHGVPPSDDPSSSSPQGNVAPTSSNDVVVSAGLPAGIQRPSARRPNRTHVSGPPTSLPHPPPVCVNAPVSTSIQPSSLSPPPDPSLHPSILPLNPPGSQPPILPVSPSSSMAPPHPSPLAPDQDSAPAQASVLGPPPSVHLLPSPLAVASSPHGSNPAPSNPPALFSPNEPTLSTNPPPSSAAQQTLVMQLIDSPVPPTQPISPVLYNVPPCIGLHTGCPGHLI
ncbi:DUF4283 domain-containing protein, partial [Cephalotus follicularis]